LGTNVIWGSYDETDVGREYNLGAYFIVKNTEDAVGCEGFTPDNWWTGYDADLGVALGNRTYNNGLWRREFAAGTVLLNEPGSSTATVDLSVGGPYTQIDDGTVVTSVQVPASSALILTHPPVAIQTTGQVQPVTTQSQTGVGFAVATIAGGSGSASTTGVGAVSTTGAKASATGSATGGDIPISVEVTVSLPDDPDTFDTEAFATNVASLLNIPTQAISQVVVLLDQSTTNPPLTVLTFYITNYGGINPLQAAVRLQELVAANDPGLTQHNLGGLTVQNVQQQDAAASKAITTTVSSFLLLAVAGLLFI